MVPRNAILFTPRGGINTSGSDDSELCIQLIGQGPINVAGSNSTFGPGSEACREIPPQLPNVSVTKGPDNGTIVGGQNAVFDITVTNHGPGDATNVTLTDVLPNSGLSWTVGGANGAACTGTARSRAARP